ncbi:dual specificity phosphatase Stp1 [Schizosaccharomyces japonicus yFS275]|uniref:Low molecular weight phosphotyrosine protein phosphatase n=1 Tax=Schizosaccharomyces japonicus (strain yFS275 / FY16936) TaxID=402676 RepID=B6JYK6_SCHJY|nr:dual specificity phosphatase Stp1 [Schizosaccharomyces japonicus yFS275]EEB06624.1 dual specificity phosphatase Stp1 [Schizosaccharomyces japonicus yFS275]
MTVENNLPKVSVLFVCLGNYCRSPMAHAVFQEEVRKQGLEHLFDTIDSAGTGHWHVGSTPDSRTMQTLHSHGVKFHHIGRKLRKIDFDQFDYIFGMDHSNIRNIEKVRPKDSKARVLLFGEYRSPGVQRIVDDPYYGGDQGFEICYQQLIDFSKNFLESLK